MAGRIAKTARGGGGLRGRGGRGRGKKGNVTGPVGSLIMKDKKPKLENDHEPADITINIHYTDSYRLIIKKMNL